MRKSIRHPLPLAACLLTPMLVHAAEPERLIGFRGPSGWAEYADPSNSPVWFPSIYDPSFLQSGLDNGQIVRWGWDTIESMQLGDLNGDGVHDKVMYQLGPAGIQIIATYTITSPLDFTTSDFNAPAGALNTPYAWIDFASSTNYLACGDLDRDGIDETCLACSGNSLQLDGNPLFPAGPATALFWIGVKTAGVPGVPSPGDFVDNGPWNSFGNAGDVAMLGDFNGDDVDDRVIFRADPAGDGSQPPQVFVDYSNPAGGWGDSAADISLTIGIVGDKLQVGDINGDGLDDFVVYGRPDPVDGNLQQLFGYYNDGNGYAAFDGGAPDIQGAWGIGDGVLFGQLSVEATPPGFDGLQIQSVTLNPDGSVTLEINTVEAGTYEIEATDDLEFGFELVGDVTGGPGLLNKTISDSILDFTFGDAERPFFFFRVVKP